MYPQEVFFFQLKTISCCLGHAGGVRAEMPGKKEGGGCSSTSPPSVLPRDRKKKRFVGLTGQEDRKKVRTESGRYISGSYKNNLYPACLCHSKGNGEAEGASTTSCSRGAARCWGRGGRLGGCWGVAARSLNPAQL